MKTSLLRITAALSLAFPLAACSESLGPTGADDAVGPSQLASELTLKRGGVKAKNFAGVWDGTITLGPSQWTWTLSQDGANVTGTTFAPGEGIITATVINKRELDVLITYQTGAINFGVVTLHGNKLSGDLTLELATGLQIPFSTEMARTSKVKIARRSIAGAPAASGLAAHYNADGSLVGGSETN